MQVFLLCKTKRARLFPVLCLAAEIILEALCQLDRLNILHIINGHDFFNYIFFSVAIFYILLGVLLGCLICLVFGNSTFLRK